MERRPDPSGPGGAQHDRISSAGLPQSPSRVVYRCETGTFVSLDTVTVTSDGTLEYDAVITLKGVGRLFDPVMALLLRRLGAQARNGLVQALGTRAPAA